MGYGQGQALSLPLFALGGRGGMGGLGGMGMGGLRMGSMGMGIGGLGIGGMGGMGDTARQTITGDRVPDGDVEVRRGEHVQAIDGEIGRIRIRDRSNRSRTHTHHPRRGSPLGGRRRLRFRSVP